LINRHLDRAHVETLETREIRKAELFCLFFKFS